MISSSKISFTIIPKSLKSKNINTADLGIAPFKTGTGLYSCLADIDMVFHTDLAAIWDKIATEKKIRFESFSSKTLMDLVNVLLLRRSLVSELADELNKTASPTVNPFLDNNEQRKSRENVAAAARAAEYRCVDGANEQIRDDEMVTLSIVKDEIRTLVFPDLSYQRQIAEILEVSLYIIGALFTLMSRKREPESDT